MIELGGRGVLAPGRWRWARALGWMAALFVLFVVVTFVVPGVLNARAGLPRAAVEAILQCLAVLAYPLYALVVRWGERRRADEIALAALPRDLAGGVLIGLGMFALVFAILRLLGVYTLMPGTWDDRALDLVNALGTGLREELIARLVVFRLSMRAFGLWPALVISALFFGGGHLANPNANLVAALAIAVEAGLMLAAFYLLTGRIWMSVGVHAAWNFAQGSIFGASVSGQAEHGSLFTSAPVAGTSALASGGAFGPEASAAAMLVGSSVFVVVILAAKRRGALSPLPGPSVRII